MLLWSGSPGVRNAIQKFEDFIAGIIDTSLEREVSFAEWSEAWERERNVLLGAMSDDLKKGSPTP